MPPGPFVVQTETRRQARNDPTAGRLRAAVLASIEAVIRELGLVG